MKGSGSQPLDRLEVLSVSPPVVDGCLHEEGSVGHRVVVKEGPEPFPAYLPQPDVLVPVERAPERSLGVVEVDHLYRLKPYELVEEGHRPLNSLPRGHVKPSREQMAGVETDAHSPPILYEVENLLQLLEAGADTVLLPRHVLQKDNSLSCALLEGLVAGLRDVSDPHHRPLPHMAPYVRHEIFDSQRVAPLHLLPKGGAAHLHQSLHGRGEVREVRHMRDDVLEARLPPLLQKGRHLPIIEGPELPTARASREDLK